MSKKIKKRLNGSPVLFKHIQSWGDSKYLNRPQLIDVFSKINLGCDVTFTAIKGESENKKFTFSNPAGDSKTVWLIPEVEKLANYNCDFAIVNKEVIDFYKIDNMNPVLLVTTLIKNFENVSIKVVISKAKHPVEVTWNLDYQSGEFSSIEMILSDEALETVNKFHEGILDYLSSVGSNVSETSENMTKIIKKSGIYRLAVNYYPEKNEETYFNQIIVNSGKTAYYQLATQEDKVKRLYSLYDNKDWNFKSSNDICYQYKHSDRKVSLKNTTIPYLDLAEFNPYRDVERIESFIHSNMESVFEKS